jgi:hypothetical protein
MIVNSLRRHLARHTGFRHLVETRGIASPWQCSQAPRSGGLRWQQRLPFLGLENRNSGSVVQSIWYHGHGRSLSYRRIQMEPH